MMTTDSFFAVMCGGMIALLFGLALAFAGYRLFLVLIPIWGFFFGFGLGAQAIMALSPNDAFLATITSWVVGFIVAAVFALLAYLFYIAAVAIVSFSLGYTATIGLLTAIGLPLAGGFFVWIGAVIVGVILAFVVLRFNVQKIVIEIATAVLGAGTIVGVFLALFGKLPPSQLFANPVGAALQASPFWMLVFIVLAVVAFFAQWQNNRSWEVQTYDRMSTAS
jgi:Ni,Fe-hydrogenase I cytochrome b subunit